MFSYLYYVHSNNFFFFFFFKAQLPIFNICLKGTATYDCCLSSSYSYLYITSVGSAIIIVICHKVTAAYT